jgi:large subunit ribosomal protein L16
MALLQPRKVKYRTKFKGRMGGVPSSRRELAFGEIGLKSLEPGWLSARQLEAARKAIVHHTKRKGRIWFRVFPDKPVTRKPPETRMGGGKGSVEGYVAVVKAGEIIVEMAGVDAETCQEALRRASHKLAVKSTIVSKD